VGTDEGAAARARSSWRGTTPSRYILEYLKDVDFGYTRPPCPCVLDCNFSDDAKVHGGVLSVYTTKNKPAGVHSSIILSRLGRRVVNINFFINNYFLLN
jgi:hypothetical protein